MKKIITLLALISALTFSQCREDEGPQYGCQTGIPKADPSRGRVFIRCCTEKEHQAGSNVNIGGISGFSKYTQVQWQPIDDCKNCR